MGILGSKYDMSLRIDGITYDIDVFTKCLAGDLIAIIIINLVRSSMCKIHNTQHITYTNTLHFFISHRYG